MFNLTSSPPQSNSYPYQRHKARTNQPPHFQQQLTRLLWWWAKYTCARGTYYAGNQTQTTSFSFSVETTLQLPSSTIPTTAVAAAAQYLGGESILAFHLVSCQQQFDGFGQQAAASKSTHTRWWSVTVFYRARNRNVDFSGNRCESPVNANCVAIVFWRMYFWDGHFIFHVYNKWPHMNVTGSRSGFGYPVSRWYWLVIAKILKK